MVIWLDGYTVKYFKIKYLIPSILIDTLSIPVADCVIIKTELSGVLPSHITSPFQVPIKLALFSISQFVPE